MLIDTRESVEEIQPDLVDVLTGEILDPKDPDSLIAAFERVDKTLKQLQQFRVTLVQAIAALTSGETKTRRLRGHDRQVKVEMPDDSWDQSILKEAWHAYPDLRDSLLRIESVGVQMREWKKAVNTTGPADFETFKTMIAKARREPTSNPRITLEEIK